jgi:hypothetical protein
MKCKETDESPTHWRFVIPCPNDHETEVFNGNIDSEKGFPVADIQAALPQPLTPFICKTCGEKAYMIRAYQNGERGSEDMPIDVFLLFLMFAPPSTRS